MPYNAELEEKIDGMTKRWNGFARKKMFGGVGYLLHGNMCAGIWKDYLIVRMDKAQAAKSLKLMNVRPFDITGTSMAGWIMVAKAGWKRRAGLEKWLKIAKSFAATLPEKKGQKKKARKKTLREYRR